MVHERVNRAPEVEEGRPVVQNEEQFRALADAMPQLIWTANRDGSIDFYNSQRREFQGFRMNEAGNWVWEPVLHPEDREATVKAWQIALKSGAIYQIEHRVCVRNGSYRWFLSRAVPLRKDGEVVKWYGTATDIDDTKKGAELLRHTEAQLSAIIAHAPIGMYLADSDLRLREINPRARPFFESMDQPIGAYVGDVMDALLPSGGAKEATNHFKEVIKTGKSFVAPTSRRNRSNGEITYFDWEIHRVTLPEGEHGVVCYLIDVTAYVSAQQRIQESEERFRTMADGVPLIVWVYDLMGRREFVNQAFCEYFGVRRERVQEGEWQVPLHPDDKEVYEREFFECLQNKHAFHAEVRVRNAQGEWRQIECWGRPRFSRVGHYQGIIGVSADVTERARAEATVRRSEQELRRLSETLEHRVVERTAELQDKTARLRGLASELVSAEHRERKRLAALLHDDLQQLLVAAKMQMGIVARHVADEKGGRAVEQASRWISEAVESARDLTRQLRPPTLYEDGLIPALHWLASEMKERHGLEIGIIESKGIRRLNDDVKALLFECIRELLFNVAKYASCERAEVKVGGEGSEFRVFISDEGEGFDVASLETNPKGKGFGLFSIRERLTALGGRMTLESSPGHGTQIELSVPLQAEEAFRENGSQSESLGPIKSIETRRPACGKDRRTRVIIVDDHAMVREGIAAMINGDERLVVVDEAANGIEAIKAVERSCPDVVLVDLNMPGMNGIEVTREICGYWPGIVVIGLSVQDDEATASSMREAGAAEFLSKGGDTKQMIATILRVARVSAPT